MRRLAWTAVVAAVAAGVGLVVALIPAIVPNVQFTLALGFVAVTFAVLSLREK